MSDKNYEIESLIYKFCRDLVLLDQQSTHHLENHVTETKQIEDSVNEIARNQGINDEVNAWDFLDPRSDYDLHSLAVKGSRLHRTTIMQFNAYFVYSFSLFEKFLSAVIKLSVRKNIKVRESYAQQFLEFAKNHQSKHGDSKYVDMLTDWKKMLDNYDELPNPLAIATRIFKVETENKRFKRYYFKYIESRERRNLLTHRGEFIDQRYLNSIKRGLGKNGQQYEKRLKDEIFKRDDFDFKNFRQNEIPAWVTPRYFRDAIETLLYIANVIHLSAFKKTEKFYRENASYSLNARHTIMRHAFDHDAFSLLIVCHDIWDYMKQEIIKAKPKDWYLFERVNYCLCNQRLVSALNSIIDKKNKTDGGDRELLSPINFEKILEHSTSDHVDHKELALAHFSGDATKLLKYAKKLNLSKQHFDDWCLFYSWQSDPALQSFFNATK